MADHIPKGGEDAVVLASHVERLRDERHVLVPEQVRRCFGAPREDLSKRGE